MIPKCKKLFLLSLVVLSFLSIQVLADSAFHDHSHAQDASECVFCHADKLNDKLADASDFGVFDKTVFSPVEQVQYFYSSQVFPHYLGRAPPVFS